MEGQFHFVPRIALHYPPHQCDDDESRPSAVYAHVSWSELQGPLREHYSGSPTKYNDRDSPTVDLMCFGKTCSQYWNTMLVFPTFESPSIITTSLASPAPFPIRLLPEAGKGSGAKRRFFCCRCPPEVGTLVKN